jgi:hypothetical protein
MGGVVARRQEIVWNRIVSSFLIPQILHKYFVKHFSALNMQYKVSSIISGTGQNLILGLLDTITFQVVPLRAYALFPALAIVSTPDDAGCGWNARRKPTRVPFCPPQIPHDLARASSVEVRD